MHSGPPGNVVYADNTLTVGKEDHLFSGADDDLGLDPFLAIVWTALLSLTCA